MSEPKSIPSGEGINDKHSRRDRGYSITCSPKNGPMTRLLSRLAVTGANLVSK